MGFVAVFFFLLKSKLGFAIIVGLMLRRIKIPYKLTHGLLVVALLFTFMAGVLHHHDDVQVSHQDCITCVSVAHSPALTSEVSVELKVYSAFVASVEADSIVKASFLAARSSTPRAPPFV